MQHFQEIENCQRLGEEETELVEEARNECLVLESDKVDIESEIREIIVPEEKPPEHSDMLLEIKACKIFDLLSRRWRCRVLHFCQRIVRDVPETPFHEQRKVYGSN